MIQANRNNPKLIRNLRIALDGSRESLYEWGMTKTLREWLPKEALQQDLPRLQKIMDLLVVAEFSPSQWVGNKMIDNTNWYRWPGSHKYVFSWCILENGVAVAWNENPSTGWSFPRLSTKLVREKVVEVHFECVSDENLPYKVYADKHGVGTTNYQPFAGKFTETMGTFVADQLKARGKPVLVEVPGVIRWTMQEKGSRYASTVAEIK